MPTQQGQKTNLFLKRQLRQSMTTAEKILWSKLRASQFEGLKFRKQHGIGPWIVDFYCAEKKLVIELDGDVHGTIEQIEKDKKRTAYLKELGLEVLRYNNDEVINNLEGVLEHLYQWIVGSTSPGPALQRRGDSESNL